MKIRKRMLYLIVAFAVSVLTVIPTTAAQKQTIYNSPYVSFAPDGKAWTTNAGDRDCIWYAQGTTVSTGIPSAVRALQTGEHYYLYDRTGEIPIGRWEVRWGKVDCCHNNYPSVEMPGYHDLPYTRNNCFQKHYSGWRAYCADCGQDIEKANIYMSSGAAETIDYFEVRKDLDYYYLCPFCNNLEQGVFFEKHKCKAISWNQYRVQYDANTGFDTISVYMPDSFHMYNNATEYDGEAVTPITHLTKNAYTRTGYEFVEWNTEPDGSGASYRDGQEIYNLTDKDHNTDGAEGTIILYAQWRKSSSTLQINPNGGSYNGDTAVTSVTKDYGSCYQILTNTLKAPKGYMVSFQTNGGSAVEPITGSGHFTEWSREVPFHGRIQDDRYYFLASDGKVDTIVANYEPDPITLPGTTKPGSSFGGWYYDPECTDPAGGPGDTIIPTKATTLYAEWVDLQLDAKDNYTANGGKGAVDLSWMQSDNKNKTYKIYQSRDNANWKLITSANDIGTQTSISESFSYSGQRKTYTVPSTGLYTLTAYGAQGANYGTKIGGAGGGVTAKIWLQKGEKLTYTIGGKNGYNGGGPGSAYGNGGGATTVSSDRQGILLIAGGGGGASDYYNGGIGGTDTSVISGGTGQGGMAGGGGGYQGGTAGTTTLGVVRTDMTEVQNKDIYLKYTLTNQASPYMIGYDLSGWHNYLTEAEVTETINGVRYYIYPSNNGCFYAKGPGYRAMYPDNYAVIVTGGYLCLKDVRTCNSGNCLASKSGYHHVMGNGAGSCWGCNATMTFYEKRITKTDPVYVQSYGGSNYINTGAAREYTRQAGVRMGNGAFSLRSESVGYQDVLSLHNVVATDYAAPDTISAAQVTKESLSGMQVQVNWQEPKDNGTDYYHVADSYLCGSASRLCRSNVTKNTLVSGIKGYYVLTDANVSTVVTASNGSFVTGRSQVVIIGNRTKYLHVAAVDKAGNIGGTIHIKMEGEDVEWKLYTEQLSLQEGDNVYPADGNKRWYVRADGSTPFTLRHNSYMDGPATAEYQPNYVIYESVMEGVSARNILYVPSAVIQEGPIRTEAEGLTYSVEGQTMLEQYPYSYVVRTERSKKLLGVQSFTLRPEASGKVIEVIPIAGAEKKEEILYSGHEADRANGIILIGDGEAPVISGLEILENKELINRTDGPVILTVTATDSLSGVKDFKLEITNTDNANRKTYTPQPDGSIRLEITRDEPIFSGDFVVTATAIDHVGNERTVDYSTTEFALQADIERILAPHDPIFKCGESGILTITTWGYAERVEVEFPTELTGVNPELNQIYVYTAHPKYRQVEQVQFMIPLDMPENQQYTITVRAYKTGRHLEDYPSLSTISVDGSVLDELRTRLR